MVSDVFSIPRLTAMYARVDVYQDGFTIVGTDVAAHDLLPRVIK